MAQYYALVAGLPNLSLDMAKTPFDVEELYAELCEILSSRDLKLLEWLRLEDLNKDFIKLYREGAFSPNDGEEDEAESEQYIEAEQVLPIGKLRYIARMAHEGKPLDYCEGVPGYVLRFLNEAYLRPSEEAEAEDKPSPSPLSDEDRLAQLYYGSASRHKNAFIASWFGFNQTLRNLLAVYTCRRLGWSTERYIVGNRAIDFRLRESKAKDFDLGEDCPHIKQMIAIATEQDIARRERMIDALRWQWLEETTEWTVFDVENVLAYYLKLSIIERWLKLDEEQGRKVFREIVLGLKAESQKALSEFRQKTKKG